MWRVASGRRRVGPSAGGADDRANSSIAGCTYRRHARAGAVARRGEVPQGAAVGLSWRYGQSLHCLRLHARPDAGRSGQLAPRIQGLFASGAYGGYDGTYHSGSVVEVACWVHVRRKFFEAKETDRTCEPPRCSRWCASCTRSRTRPSRSTTPRGASFAEAAERADPRASKPGPMPSNRRCCLSSPMGQAIQYALNQWNALCVYATEGFLAIDNNAAERAMKRVAIGRKNWLFAGNNRAGQTTAILYTLIASADRHGADPQRDPTSIFARLPFGRRARSTSFCRTCGSKTTRPSRRREPAALVDGRQDVGRLRL